MITIQCVICGHDVVIRRKNRHQKTCGGQCARQNIIRRRDADREANPEQYRDYVWRSNEKKSIRLYARNLLAAEVQ